MTTHKMLTTLLISNLSVIAFAGCASTPGAQPQDMSKVQHEQAAAGHDRLASSHAGSYDSSATQCVPPNQSTTNAIPNSAYTYAYSTRYGSCWTSIANPTAQHKDDAERHGKMAADHRAAAQSLREAEARSCAGVTEGDRDMSPFNHRDDITGVAAYNRPQDNGPENVDFGPRTGSLHGAVVAFRATPGMTTEWLQRVVSCHVARNASVGFDMPEMSYCPLNVKGARATVRSAVGGFSVTIESDDLSTAKDILRRAQSLVARSDR